MSLEERTNTATSRAERYLQRIQRKESIMSGTTSGGTVTPVTTAFIMDPYSSNINPGTEAGRKLFLKATEKRSDTKKINVTQANAKEFLELMMDDAKNFSWGVLVHRITDEDGEVRSILRNIRKLSLDRVKRQAMRIWFDETATHTTALPQDFLTTAIDPANNQAHQTIFYNRTRSTMNAKRILGSISTSSRKTLFTKKKDFAWMDNATGEYNYDGPTILHILMLSVNPNTRVGVTGLKEKMRATHMGAFNHNVKALLTDIATNYNMILEQGFSHEDVVMITFIALLTSKNVEFNSYIQRHKDAWEEGKTFTLNGLSIDTINKYNNMIHQKLWNKADPKDTKLLALSTEVQDLKTQIKRNNADGASSVISSSAVAQ